VSSGAKLNLVPQDRRFYLFRRQGELVSDTLSELSKSLLEGRSRRLRMRDLEYACDEVTRRSPRWRSAPGSAPIEQADIVDRCERVANLLLTVAIRNA
jgi:hypothetical protein